MPPLDDVIAIPDHLEDALWRVDSARLEAAESSGLVVCGMGGSAIGGDLARAVLGARLEAPMLTVRGYELPSWADSGWTVLCSSYSGETEETLACFEAARRSGARRIVVGTGGTLVERARTAEDPVIGLPGILQPREAVAYMFVSAAAAASLAGAAPGIVPEIEAAAGFLRERVEGLRERAAEVAAAISEDGEALPIVCGAGATVPVSRRWKTQINENAKLQAFCSELPEADHNEICGWDAVPEATRATAILIEDPEQGERLGRRFALTGEAISAAGIPVVRIEVEGGTPTEKVLWSVMLGDLVSLELAAARGVDPLDIRAIERLKSALGQP